MWRKLFGTPKANPAQAAAGLRRQALTAAPEELGLSASADSTQVFGVLMETGYAGAVVTLAAFADGSASLYFSTGGGVIGGGEHQPVRAAARTLVAFAEKLRSQLAPTEEFPMPGVGRVRFFVRTGSGVLTAEADEKLLAANRSEWTPLFLAGHNVITQLRLLSGPTSEPR